MLARIKQDLQGNKEILDYLDSPKNSKTRSWGANPSNKELAKPDANGIYYLPVVVKACEYDSNVQIRLEDAIVTSDTEVIKTYGIRDKTAEEILADKKQKAQQELTDLDSVLPRAIEDLIEALGVNETTLPNIMQERLALKRQARLDIK